MQKHQLFCGGICLQDQIRMPLLCCSKAGAELATVLQRQQEADTKRMMIHQHSLLCSTWDQPNGCPVTKP